MIWPLNTTLKGQVRDHAVIPKGHINMLKGFIVLKGHAVKLKGLNDFKLQYVGGKCYEGCLLLKVIWLVRFCLQ